MKARIDDVIMIPGWASEVLKQLPAQLAWCCHFSCGRKYLPLLRGSSFLRTDTRPTAVPAQVPLGLAQFQWAEALVCPSAAS